MRGTGLGERRGNLKWMKFRIRKGNALLLTGMIALTASAQEQSQPQQEAQIPRQEASKRREADVKPERWNLFYQATSIGQYHGTFHSPYSGQLSLQNNMERDVSLTTTLFLGLRLE